MKSLEYSWISERFYRCNEQIWEVSKQILMLRGNVVLDLGFITKKQRETFITKAKELGINTEVHYLDVPVDVRKKRVKQRNFSKDSDVYFFEVTDMMFNFMEQKFEVPNTEELVNGCTINA